MNEIRSFLSGSSRGSMIQESESARFNKDAKVILDFHFADKAVRLFTFCWLIYQGITYFTFADRPEELFRPMNWYDGLLMSTFPSVGLFFSVLVVAAGLTVFTLLRPQQWSFKLLLAFLVMYINALKWSYGFFSHVGHIVILYHLLSAFIPAIIPTEKKEFKPLASSIKWFHFGVFVTYTCSGLWKLVGLAYKMVFQPEVINWLSPQAAKVNAVVGYRDWDMPIGDWFAIYDIPVFWQVMVVIMLFLQVFSFLGGFVRQLTIWVALGNILFHIHNIVFVMIHFYLTPMVLFIAFFPYRWIMKSKTQEVVETVESVNYDKETRLYTRVYSNGDKDIFEGFYGKREHAWDKGKWWSGWLYFPLLDRILTKDK